MKTTAKTHSLIVAVLAGASFISPSLLHAQITITLDGTSGSNSISTDYTLPDNSTVDLGFFAEYLLVGGGGGANETNNGSFDIFLFSSHFKVDFFSPLS